MRFLIRAKPSYESGRKRESAHEAPTSQQSLPERLQAQGGSLGYRGKAQRQVRYRNPGSGWPGSGGRGRATDPVKSSDCYRAAPKVAERSQAIDWGVPWAPFASAWFFLQKAEGVPRHKTRATRRVLSATRRPERHHTKLPGRLTRAGWQWGGGHSPTACQVPLN